MSSSPQHLIAAFLERPGSAHALLQHPDSSGASCCAVVESWAVQQEARAVGLPCVVVDEVFDSATADEANRNIEEFRRHWYWRDGEDFTVYRGVSLGSLLEYEFSYTVLFPLVRTVYAATRVITERRPDSVVTD